jgi:pyruvate carboxylase
LNSLEEYKINGLPTNIPFLKRVLLNKDFKEWNYDTSFIALNYEELLGKAKINQEDSQTQRALLAISNIWLKIK